MHEHHQLNLLKSCSSSTILKYDHPPLLLNHSMIFVFPVIKLQFFKRGIMHFNGLLMQRVSLVCMCMFSYIYFVNILFIKGTYRDDGQL